jgi:predicted nucleotide-binding protein (sugar kinase/HSP70/actin superfamily)
LVLFWSQKYDKVFNHEKYLKDSNNFEANPKVRLLHEILMRITLVASKKLSIAQEKEKISK